MSPIASPWYIKYLSSSIILKEKNVMNRVTLGSPNVKRFAKP
jgi:hypothetical protein